MGSALGPGRALLLGARKPTPLRAGSSAAVRRRLRSALLADEGVSVRGGGREDRASAGDDAEEEEAEEEDNNGAPGPVSAVLEGAVEACVGCGRICVESAPASRRKSAHVSPP